MSKADLVRQGMRAWEANDAATVRSLLTEDFVFEGGGAPPMNKEEFLAFMHAMLTGLPDFTFNETAIEERGERAEARYHVTGTHTGQLVLPGMPPIPATGKRVQLPEDRAEYEFVGEQTAKITLESPPDGGMAGLLKQLGVQLPG